MLSVRAACGLEAGDRVFDAVGKSLRVGGHVLGAASPKNEVLRPDQKVSYLDHLSLQHRSEPQRLHQNGPSDRMCQRLGMFRAKRAGKFENE